MNGAMGRKMIGANMNGDNSFNFDCPKCGQPQSANVSDAYLEAVCTHCGERIMIPPPRMLPALGTTVIRDIPKATEPKKVEDIAAEAICAVAKGAWKFTKVAVPIAGRVTVKVVDRAARAVAKAPLAQELAKPTPPPSKPARALGFAYQLWRLFGG